MANVSELDLNYWREDPILNEHHEHWHLVYPFGGRPDPHKALSGKLTWAARHGELFSYMHAQLLARYEAERYSIRLKPVVPFDDYRQPILDGYNPNIAVTTAGAIRYPGNRSDNTYLRDLTSAKFSSRPGAQISNQEQFRNRLRAALSNSRPPTLSDFSEILEPTDRSALPHFGALHNDGHILIAMHDDNPNAPGCLFYEEIALRDPVFYQWHRHIDDLFRQYQDALPPYDFVDLPPVTVRAIAVFSSGQWNKLHTCMRTRLLRTSPSHQVIKYLSHDDFSYHIKVDNPTQAGFSVTVRIFLAPEQLIDDRRAWVEMDKFKYLLPPGRTQIKRESKNSSVIRHPVLTHDMLEGRVTAPDDRNASLGCLCGWPYTLLLPRGTPKGMLCRVMALISPGDDLSSKIVDGHDSSSYCGLKDDEYPDKRAMGYPFDRPFISFRNWISGAAKPPQLTSEIVTIFHRGMVP